MLKIDRQELAEDWKEWQERRVTKLVQQYLKDFVDAVVQSHADAFRDGTIVPEDIQIRESAKCIAYSDVAELELETIFKFYEEDHADQTVTESTPSI